jgi:GNAT superfamily N-acetyltransferase
MIRKATAQDIPACVEMGRLFHAESGVADLVPFDADSVRGVMEKLVDGGDGVLLVAELEGQLIGMTSGIAYPHYFNQAKKAAQELFWWVLPEKRGGTAGVRLLTALEHWAKDVGASTLTMICLPIDSPAESIYARTGYRPIERSFMKGL